MDPFFTSKKKKNEINRLVVVVDVTVVFVDAV
jgi:hypothetical protein